MSLVGQIASLQDYKEYEDLNWEGSFEEYLDLVRKNPRVTRNAFQRVYDMILAYGTEEYIDNKKKLVRYNFFKDDDRRRRGRDLRPRRPADAAGERASSPRPRATAPSARHPAARPGRLVEVHHRPPAQEGPRGLLAHAGRRALHLRLDAARASCRAWPAAARRFHVPDARGAAAPHPARVARRAPSTSSALAQRAATRCKVDGDLDPSCRFIFQRADGPATTATGRKVMRARPRAAPDPVARRTASASARSSRRTRRTRTRPSSPATSTTARSPSTARDCDPRAFNFDGEFNIANRGIIEFVEVLKLDVAFLYDLLGASARSTRSSRRSSRRPTSTR